MVVELDGPVVDLQHLESFTDGDPELERELTALYLTTAEGYLAELARADDNEMWRRSAHALKGASANLGALRVAALALGAETSAPDPDLLACLRAEVAEVRQFFQVRR